MRLISIATHGCKFSEPLFAFIRDNAVRTDIFCFQEILKGGVGKTSRGEHKNAYEEMATLLPEHTGYFFEYGEGGYYSENSKDLDFKYGIACFVRSNLKQSLGGGALLYDSNKRWSDYEGEIAAGAALAVQVESCTIINVHGLWQGRIKKDTEAKLAQSDKIMILARQFSGKKVICGDFNLLPDTQSIQMFRDTYRDLIREYGISDTRGPLYTKELRYADYLFTDKDINVHSFSVPHMSVSDHLPLIAEFE